mmetsp:Transcript_3541/g.9639  ORF Transcript_3541/g.9639 Transcript_3541/m.9639 type:complete len:189 (-) Transcript_3541:131-697(-)
MPGLSVLLGFGEHHSLPVVPEVAHTAFRSRTGRTLSSAYTSFFGEKRCCCSGKGYKVREVGDVVKCEKPANLAEYHQHPKNSIGKTCNCKGLSAANAHEMASEAQEEMQKVIDAKWADIEKKLESITKERGVVLKGIKKPIADFKKFDDTFLCCCASGKKGGCSFSRTCLSGYWVDDKDKADQICAKE